MRMKITMILIVMTMAMWMLMMMMLITIRPFSQRGIQGCGNELSPNCCAWSWSWNEVLQTCKTFWKMITNLCQRKNIQRLNLSPARSQWSTGLSEHSQRRIFPSYLKNENKLQEINVFIFHFQIFFTCLNFKFLKTNSPQIHALLYQGSELCTQVNNATFWVREATMQHYHKRGKDKCHLGEYFSIRSFGNGLQNHQNQCQPG